jgi:hypothetical protein
MKNKTALQELMDWMIDESEVIPVDPGDVYQKAKELLVKEKEQIMKAYLEGESDGDHLENSTQIYYNETYGN